MMRVLSIALLLVLLAALAALHARAPGPRAVEPSSAVRIAPSAAPAELIQSERAVIPPARASLSADVTAGDDRSPHDLRLERGIDLRGTVRAAATGRELASAHVRYYQSGELKQVECNPDGTFDCVAVHGEPARALGLRIECDGFLPTLLELEPAQLQRDPAPFDVRLEKGIVVSGRILDAEHKPVAGALLALFTPTNFQATSDELGQFEFGGIEPTEKATLFSADESWSRPPILAKAFELGAIRASRFDVELVVPEALQVQVFAELANGEKLDPGRFEVDWGDGFLRDVWLLQPEIFLGSKGLQSRVLPRGPDLDLVVTARAPGTDDRNAILRGKAHVHTDRTVANPLEVHVRLDEPGRLAIPSAPAGAPEIRLGEDTQLLGAFDVQLLDADSGKPIQGANSVAWSRNFMETTFDWLTPGPDGWVRIWHPIGKIRLNLDLTRSSTEQFESVIPRTGYAKVEWRLRSKL